MDKQTAHRELAPWARGRLQASRDGHGFEYPDGTPFFLLGDTAWEMIHRASEAEVATYLARRTAQGFNTIFTVAVAELDGFNRPNHAGQTPFAGTDLARPNEAYWTHVDRVLAQAEAAGFYVALLPAWGTWVDQGLVHENNATGYGSWLGARYAARPNLIWILGGDLDFQGFHGSRGSVFRAMAEGIRRSDPGHLMGYHPKTRSSAYAHAEPWLDFHLLQTGHRAADNAESYHWVAADRALIPPKPTLDGEPRYEDHPIDWKEENGTFGDFDVRQAAYWSVLAGAAGHVYGHISVIAWKNSQLSPLPWYLPASACAWPEALEAPGAEDMRHLAKLVSWAGGGCLKPDQSLVTSDNPPDGGHVRAARSDPGLLVYSPFGRAFEIDLPLIPGDQLRCTWFDPRRGEMHALGERSNGIQTFVPPGTAGRGNDWVLVASSDLSSARWDD